VIGGWILLGAHLQIRSVNPPLPTLDQLLAAVSGGAGPVSVSFVNTSTQGTAAGGEMGHPSFVLEWPDGRKFLIDTGMDSDEALSFGRGMELVFGAKPAVAHGALPSQMGMAVRQVLGVGFTHLHPDHTQGLEALCAYLDRMLPIFQTPWQFEHRNHTTEMGFASIEAAQRLSMNGDCGVPHRLDVSSEASFYPVPGFPGLVAVATAGHTPGSTAFLARVGDRHWLFSGDITNTRADLLENRPKARFYSLLIVPESPERLATLRPWLAAIDADPRIDVIVSHDLTALEETGLPAWRSMESPP
jgi:glyoxylase-like metal-dependent hydrolase (beta-lactamase superfamily II)